MLSENFAHNIFAVYIHLSSSRQLAWTTSRQRKNANRFSLTHVRDIQFVIKIEGFGYMKPCLLLTCNISQAFWGICTKTLDKAKRWLIKCWIIEIPVYLDTNVSITSKGLQALRRWMPQRVIPWLWLFYATFYRFM